MIQIRIMDHQGKLKRCVTIAEVKWIISSESVFSVFECAVREDSNPECRSVDGFIKAMNKFIIHINTEYCAWKKVIMKFHSWEFRLVTPSVRLDSFLPWKIFEVLLIYLVTLCFEASAYPYFQIHTELEIFSGMEKSVFSW